MSNVVFILLVILFFSILLTFVVKQSSKEYILEEQAAKKIALAIDAAKPGTQIFLNLANVLEKNVRDEPITIQGNIVYVKLTEKTGYGYSFFNNVNVEVVKQGNGKIMDENGGVLFRVR
mgnify:CR=1 FL=1